MIWKSRIRRWLVTTIVLALAAGLFGTFTPFASTWLIDHTGDKASPGSSGMNRLTPLAPSTSD